MWGYKSLGQNVWKLFYLAIAINELTELTEMNDDDNKSLNIVTFYNPSLLPCGCIDH